MWPWRRRAPADPPKRPRIGLVLGGGGAKGGAHIGVIKVLEEMRIPIDCIAGTSMGSIVGAAYSTGMTAQQLETVVTAIDWKEILQSAPREEVPVRRKQQDFIFTNGAEFGLKDGGVIAPTGIVPTHQIETMFRRIVASAGKISDFDALPIPFRAVATDLESGEMVVFDRGELAVAMRSSMAVPGAFAPVDHNGRLLVDGMLVRNLPVDVARQTCADVVIAVPVGNPAARRDQLGTLLSVAGQAMNIAIEANEKAQLATLMSTDVEVRVTLENITSSDFKKVPEAIPIGEAAARREAASLARYSLSPSEYAEWRAHLEQLAAAPRPKIDEVRVTGLERTDAGVVKAFIDTKPGDTFDPDKSDADSSRLVARRDYTSVSYQLMEEDGRNVLVYNAVEKPWGPDYLAFDANLSTDFKADAAWGLRVSYEKRWLNSLGGEFRSNVQLGRPNLFTAEFYQPVDARQMFFIAPSVFAKQTLEYLYRGDETIAQFDTRRYGVELDVGVALGTWGEYRLGVVRGKADTRPKAGEVPLPDEGRSDLGAVVTRFLYDSLDKRNFPSSGSSINLTGNFSNTGLGAESTYQSVSLGVGTVVTANKDVFTLLLKGGSDLNSGTPYYDQFRLGGLFNFSGYQNGSLIGREYALAALQYRRRGLYLVESRGTALYSGFSLEAGNVFERVDGTRASGALMGGSVFVGLDTGLGPVYLAYGLSQGGRYALYLYLGSSFEAFRP